MGNLIKCSMCGKEISPNAVSCPNCGEPMKKDHHIEIKETILMIKKENDKYGYVDENDDFMIKPIFDDATEFNEGIASVKIGDKWGAIDLDGKIIIEPTFDNKLKFRGDKARVKINGSWKYINTKGKIIKNLVNQKKGHEEKYSIIIKNIKSGRNEMIEIVRKIRKCDISTANNICNHVPFSIIDNIKLENAKWIKGEIIEDKYVKVEIEIIETDKVQAFIDLISDNIIKCPNCKATNVKKISGLSKAGSAVMFGIFSMGKLNKTYECENCGYRW